jgi:poly-gamma-glutamate synthesis protein (capsule biosynthesis protein)
MSSVTLFLCGDVMTGRGIDQVLPHPSAPQLHEAYCRSALEYVELAEHVSGAIARPVDYAYVWGDGLAELEQRRPDARIVNLETAVTTSDSAWPGKDVHYRMHPANVRCLQAARLDCCVLANNHVLDWGRRGLKETLAVLHGAGLRTAGAGSTLDEARAPAVIPVAGNARVLVYAYAMANSGVPAVWAAGAARSGITLLPDLAPTRVSSIARRVARSRRAGDVVVLSIHWGSNWDYEVDREQRAFAHAVIDEASVNVVHGHSSHHVKGVEVYRGGAVLYGCGDFLNDYEGISGHESFRPDLALMYFPTFCGAGLTAMLAVPTRVARFRIERAGPEDAAALARIARRECAKLDTAVELGTDGALRFGPA